MGREDYRLLKELIKVPGHLPLKLLMPMNAGSFLRHLLGLQEKAVPKYQMSMKRDRGSAWLSTEALLELRCERKLYGL